MPLAMIDAAAEKVYVSMAEDAAEDVGGEVDKVEEDAADDFVEEAAPHMKMGLTSQMSTVTLNT